MIGLQVCQQYIKVGIYNMQGGMRGKVTACTWALQGNAQLQCGDSTVPGFGEFCCFSVRPDLRLILM